MNSSSFWVYSDKDCTETYEGLQFIKKEKLLKGWNFISITPDMLNYNIEEVFGACDFEKVYVWEARKNPQSWLELPGIGTGSFRQDVLFIPMVLKTTNECTLLDNIPPAIPPIPE